MIARLNRPRLRPLGQPDPAHRRLPPAHPPTRQRRPPRPRHRRPPAPLHHHPRAGRRPARAVQDPPRLPLPRLRRDLPRRHLPTHPRGPGRRQGRPGHGQRTPVPVRHPHRPLLRHRPHPAGEERQGPALPRPPRRRHLPARPGHVLHRPARRRRPPAGRTAVPGLLRLRGLGPVQRHQPRTVAALHRSPPPALRQTLRPDPRRYANRPSISFAKVAEYQRRGVVHFHAVIRLDGPDGPHYTPPAWATADALDRCRPARRRGRGHRPEIKPLSRTFRWGAQLDVRRITMTGDLTEQAVAAYIAKYATKAAECVGTLDRRIQPLDDLDRPPHPRPRPTADRRVPAPGRPRRPGRPPAHPMGPHARLPRPLLHQEPPLLHHPRRPPRRPRTNTCSESEITTGRLPLFDEDTVLVVAHWQYAGQGLSAGDQLLAAALTGHLPSTPARGSPMTRLLLTVPEAAEALAISRSKLYELLASGAVASIRIDGSRRIPVSALTTTSPTDQEGGRRMTQDPCRHPGRAPAQEEGAQATRRRHETRNHLVLRHPRQDPETGESKPQVGRRLRHRRRRQGRP